LQHPPSAKKRRVSGWLPFFVLWQSTAFFGATSEEFVRSGFLTPSTKEKAGLAAFAPAPQRVIPSVFNPQCSPFLL